MTRGIPRSEEEVMYEAAIAIQPAASVLTPWTSAVKSHPSVERTHA